MGYGGIFISRRKKTEHNGGIFSLEKNESKKGGVQWDFFLQKNEHKRGVAVGYRGIFCVPFPYSFPWQVTSTEFTHFLKNENVDF